MEVRGKVIVVQPPQTGEGRNGVWKKQEYVVEYDQNSQYPRRMMFNLWGEKIDQFNIQEGQMIRVEFDIDCREYSGRWYNDIRAWKVEIDNESPVDSGSGGFVSAPPVGGGSDSNDDNSDLPF